MAHTGAVHRVWAYHIRERRQEPTSRFPLEILAGAPGIEAWADAMMRGEPEPIPTALAADGIAHTFEVMLPMRRQAREAPAGRGERFVLAPSDLDETWLVRFNPEDVSVSTDSGDADVTLRGTASDLFLFLWQRLPGERLSLGGDPILLDRYFELVPPI